MYFKVRFGNGWKGISTSDQTRAATIDVIHGRALHCVPICRFRCVHAPPIRNSNCNRDLSSIDSIRELNRSRCVHKKLVFIIFIPILLRVVEYDILDKQQCILTIQGKKVMLEYVYRREWCASIAKLSYKYSRYSLQSASFSGMCLSPSIPFHPKLSYE